jgi:hypothetical protein
MLLQKRREQCYSWNRRRGATGDRAMIGWLKAGAGPEQLLLRPRA